MTWAKLSAIQANCGIEMTLDACMLRLSEVVAAKKKVRLGLDGPKKKPPCAGLFRAQASGSANIPYKDIITLL